MVTMLDGDNGDNVEMLDVAFISENLSWTNA